MEGRKHDLDHVGGVLRSTRIGPIWMWEAVGLILVVVGIEAYEILLNKKFQVSGFIQFLLTGDTDLLVTDPRIGDGPRNADDDIAVRKRAGERAVVDLLKRVSEIVFRQTAKSDGFLY